MHFIREIFRLFKSLLCKTTLYTSF